ncbi:MAG: hypothetical protein KatS3mg118_3070 [Paracoccaceae bacterium]|nr:MAG: hypothetical protein KatS3mg118_3070 [Paracoccaceae bacterium]
MATALERYALLEAPGVWFDGRSARPHEVIVRFGEATLILLGPGDLPVAHWALASLRALPGQGAGMMVLVPDADSDERLTIGDPDMIAAIRAVCPELERPRAAPGTRRRLALWGAGAVAAVLAMVFLLIPMLAERLAPMIPPAREEALGRAVIGQLQQLLARTGAPGRGMHRAAPAAPRWRGCRGRLARHAPTHVPIRLTVLDHPMVNAVRPARRACRADARADRTGDRPRGAGRRDRPRDRPCHASRPHAACAARGGHGGAGGASDRADLVGGTAGRGAGRCADPGQLYPRGGGGRRCGPRIASWPMPGCRWNRSPTSSPASARSGSAPTGFLAHLATHPDPAARAEAARAGRPAGRGAVPPGAERQRMGGPAGPSAEG